MFTIKYIATESNPNKKKNDLCFSQEGYLATNNSERWITEAINSMKAASPTSLKVFLKSVTTVSLINYNFVELS